MARTRYDAATKQRAIALGAEVGPGEAARRLGIPKPTVASWMLRTGVRTGATERTHAATEAVKATMEERRARLADTLLGTAEIASRRELELLAEASLRDVVGARTRAIHDHQLLVGAPTARTEHSTAPEAAHAVLDEIAARRATHAA